MDKITQKQLAKSARARRVRAKISGSESCPRVTINKTTRHLNVQAIDDVKGTTLASITTKTFESKNTGINLAAELGESFGEKLKEAKIKEIVFDRKGSKYHGRVAAFADGIRKAGIKF